MICNNLGSGQWHREVSSHTECHSSRKRIQEHPLFNNFFMSVSTSPRGARGQTPPLTSGFHCAGQKRNTGDTEQTGIIRDQRPETDPGNFRGVIQCWNSCGTAAPLQTTASWWKHTNKTLTQNVETRVLKVCHSAHVPKWTWKSRVHYFAGCLGCRLWKNLPQSFSVQKATEISSGVRGLAMAAHNFEQRWQPRHGSMLHGTLNDSHNASLGHKLAALETKDPLNTDFLQWMLPAVNRSHINTNFEWCCDCLFKSISWPKNLVSDAAKQCNKSTWMNFLLEGSQIQNILIYSSTTCFVFMRFFFQKGVLLRHRPSSLGPRWREGHNWSHSVERNDITLFSPRSLSNKAPWSLRDVGYQGSLQWLLL